MSEGLTKEQQSMLDEMTPLNQRFAVNLTLGMNQGRAYKMAGGEAKDIYAGACGLLRNPKIMEFVDSVRKDQANKAVLKREDAIRILSGFAQVPLDDARFKNADPHKAIAQLSQMHGWDSVYKWDKPDEGEEDNQTKDEPVNLAELAERILLLARTGARA